MEHIIQVLSFLLLVISHCHATEAECIIADLQTTTETMNGQYEGNRWTISFRASHERNNISSVVTFQDSTDGDIPAVTSLLSFAYSTDRKIPGMSQLVVDAAVKVSEDNDCNLPESLNQLYEEFANALFNCTTHMGFSQLRFSVMYHMSVIGSAKRICSGAKTNCTHSPEYDLGNQMFMCGEDMEELFPYQVQQGKNRLAKLEEDMASFEEASNEAVPRGKRTFIGTVLGSVACLNGGDWCCCGNYAGCCWFASIGCCVHDAVCTCCRQWHCGPDCVPDSGC